MGLKEIRLKKGFTLMSLGKASGVHWQKIDQIERGKIKAGHIWLQNAVKIARTLGCEPEDLLTTEELEALKRT